MTATEISRHLHHVRADYDNGVWRAQANVFDKDDVFIAVASGCGASLLLAVAELTRNAIDSFRQDEENTRS